MLAGPWDEDSGKDGSAKVQAVRPPVLLHVSVGLSIILP